jgi:protein-disulfide isomerase
VTRARIVASVVALTLVACQEPRPDTRRVVQVSLPAEGLEVGPGDTAFVIVEFGSFLCPFCRVFHDSVYPVITRDYIETRKARFRFVSIDTASALVRLAAWVACRSDDGLTAALADAFALAAPRPLPPIDSLVSLPQQGQSIEECILAKVPARRQELAGIQRLGVRAVPTFLVGAQAPGDGRIVGWVVEGLREPQLYETIRAAHALASGGSPPQ